jgi:hypothetical protein
MSTLKGKYTVEEIEGIRCRIVANGVSQERANFVKEILEFNKYIVKIELEKKKDETSSDTFKVGVTDITFNPTISIYERKLKFKNGKSVTPANWEQEASEFIPFYWERR